MRYVGVPPDRAGRAARSIKEHSFDGMWWAPSQCVGPDRLDLEVEPVEVGDEPLEPSARTIDRRHPGTGGRELRGLAAWGGAQIDDLAPGEVAEQPRGDRPCGVLNPPGPFRVAVHGPQRPPPPPAQP